MMKYETAVKTNHKNLVLKQKNARHRRTHATCIHMPCVQKKQANLNNMWFRDVFRHGQSCIEKCRNH